MWYAIAGLAGLLVGAGGMWWYSSRQKVEPPAPVDPDAELRAAVRELHQVLFAPYGTIVTSFFNKLWRAMGLEEKGVPNINNGRT